MTNLNESIIRRLPESLSPIPTGLNPDGQLASPAKAVLFDIYGTLFISDSGDISIAEENSRISDDLKDLLRKYHIDRPPEAILNSFFNSIRATHQQLRANGVDHPEVEIDLIWSEVLGINNPDPVRDLPSWLASGNIFCITAKLSICGPHPLILGICSEVIMFV